MIRWQGNGPGGEDSKADEMGDSRVFPALVVDTVHVAIFLVSAVLDFDFQDLGLVEQFVVEAEHSLVLCVSSLGGRRHGGRGVGRILELPCGEIVFLV